MWVDSRTSLLWGQRGCQHVIRLLAPLFQFSKIRLGGKVGGVGLVWPSSNGLNTTWSIKSVGQNGLVCRGVFPMFSRRNTQAIKLLLLVCSFLKSKINFLCRNFEFYFGLEFFHYVSWFRFYLDTIDWVIFFVFVLFLFCFSWSCLVFSVRLAVSALTLF